MVTYLYVIRPQPSKVIRAALYLAMVVKWPQREQGSPNTTLRVSRPNGSAFLC